MWITKLQSSTLVPLLFILVLFYALILLCVDFCCRAGTVSGTVHDIPNSPIVKQGYLNKKGANRQNWKTRWFVLRFGHLVYCRSPQVRRLWEYVLLYSICLSMLLSCLSLTSLSFLSYFSLVSLLLLSCFFLASLLLLSCFSLVSSAHSNVLLTQTIFWLCKYWCTSYRTWSPLAPFPWTISVVLCLNPGSRWGCRCAPPPVPTLSRPRRDQIAKSGYRVMTPLTQLYRFHRHRPFSHFFQNAAISESIPSNWRETPVWCSSESEGKGITKRGEGHLPFPTPNCGIKVYCNWKKDNEIQIFPL